MTLAEAIMQRHSVRNYLDKPIAEEALAALRAEISRINADSGLNIQLVTDEPRAFSAGVLKYGKFSGVSNYLVMAAPKGSDAEEAVGYRGEQLVLLAQTLGLNSCWVGLTYKKIDGAFTLREGDVVHCVISLGYGTTAGVQHPQKKRLEEFVEAEGELPGWFRAGMEAVLLAPTAVNQQKFRFVLHEGSRVEARPVFSMVGYTHIDLGIAKCHFEIGAGKDNFRWT